MKRRLFIHGMAASAVIGSTGLQAATRGLLPTIRQSEGPFYPVKEIPLTNSLIQGEHTGEKFNVSGRLLWLDGSPVSDARIELWQCDSRGVYDHPRAPQGNGMDPGFRGFAAVNTDAEGNYQFETIMPVAYFGRPPHIHVMIHTDGRRRLTTQLYIKGKGGPMILQLHAMRDSAGVFTANYDLVLNKG